jgi:hypothetical protein
MGQPSEFCTGVCEEKRQLEGGRRSERTWAREAEESPLLEAVARERLVKTQQGGKDLAGAVVICELWTLVMVLFEVIICLMLLTVLFGFLVVPWVFKKLWHSASDITEK